MINSVTIVGRIANDLELKYTGSGIGVLSFRVALDRPQSAESRQNGQEKETDFVDVVAWRQSAELLGQYGGKGRMIGVQGRLQVRSDDT